MRDDEPDERDRAAGGGRRAAQDGDRHEQDQPRPPDALAEGDGDVLAEGEPVERPAAGEGDDDADDDERRGLPEDRHVAAGQRADLPEPQLVEGVDVGQDDGRRDRRQAGGDRGAGEGELDRRRALAAERRDAVDEDRGRRPRRGTPARS